MTERCTPMCPCGVVHVKPGRSHTAYCRPEARVFCLSRLLPVRKCWSLHVIAPPCVAADAATQHPGSASSGSTRSAKPDCKPETDDMATLCQVVVTDAWCQYQSRPYQHKSGSEAWPRPSAALLWAAPPLAAAPAPARAISVVPGQARFDRTCCREEVSSHSQTSNEGRL